METQGDLVVALAMEVREASFTHMEDVVSFAIWLDEKLSSLVYMILNQLLYSPNSSRV